MPRLWFPVLFQVHAGENFRRRLYTGSMYTHVRAHQIVLDARCRARVSKKGFSACAWNMTPVGDRLTSRYDFLYACWQRVCFVAASHKPSPSAHPAFCAPPLVLGRRRRLVRRPRHRLSFRPRQLTLGHGGLDVAYTTGTNSPAVGMSYGAQLGPHGCGQDRRRGRRDARHRQKKEGQNHSRDPTPLSITVLNRLSATPPGPHRPSRRKFSEETPPSMTLTTHMPIFS